MHVEAQVAKPSNVDPSIRGISPNQGISPEATAYIPSEIAAEAYVHSSPKGQNLREFRAAFIERYGELFAGHDNQRLAALKELNGVELSGSVLVEDPVLLFCVTRLAQEDPVAAVRKKALYLLQDAYHSSSQSTPLRAQILGGILSTSDDPSRAVVKQALDFFEVNPSALLEPYTLIWPSTCTESGPAAVLAIAGRLEAHLVGPLPAEFEDREQIRLLDASREQALQLVKEALKRGMGNQVEHHVLLSVRRLLRPGLERSENGELALPALMEIGSWCLNHHAVVQYFARRLEHGSAREQILSLNAVQDFLRSERAAKVALPQGNWVMFREIAQALAEADITSLPAEDLSAGGFCFATNPNPETFFAIKELASEVAALIEMRLKERQLSPKEGT